VFEIDAIDAIEEETKIRCGSVDTRQGARPVPGGGLIAARWPGAVERRSDSQTALGRRRQVWISMANTPFQGGGVHPIA
jgi:hypothetical protein